MELEQSYDAAERICRSSGSNFFRSFQFLRSDRRRAMHVLYAFARLADDAADDSRPTVAWNRQAWLKWLHRLADADRFAESSPAPTEDCSSIEPALEDAILRFRIPVDMLEALILGMDRDAQGCQMRTWDDLKKYAFQVASSVGICCTAIWTDGHPVKPSQPPYRSAVDCGIAFQLTNILRDLREDAARGRVYLPSEDLHRFGIDRAVWLQELSNANQKTHAQFEPWLKLIEVQIERARGLFASGWQIHRLLAPDSFRMFSLMWHTYRSILATIERDPAQVLRQRVRLGTPQKIRLAATHLFTPLLARVTCKTDRETAWFEQVDAPKLEGRTPRVAVVGAGLAGINAALHLGRHGCDVVVFEAKSRLGGRAGSFLDPATGQTIDYCQHVGMQCCTQLRRWIANTGASDAWRTLDTLHFVSKTGKQLAVQAWPLPAPFHLSGLILGWPDLSLLDRLRVAMGLSCLLVARETPSFQATPAIEWLNRHFQNRRTIDRFWGTILVSALGEQVDRIAMGPVKKVLVDGFAATRDAFHLLVPTRPLSQIMDESPRHALRALGVEVRCGTSIQSLRRSGSEAWQLNHDEEHPFDAVVATVPWHRMGALFRDAELPNALQQQLLAVESLESSPITGVHTWWDRPWLNQPHAILIDRLCQWVFPGPDSSTEKSSTGETYYQVVISGSRQLPRGDHDAILRVVEQDLKELFPEAADANLLRGKVVTDPQSVFSVSPGHASSRLPSSAFASEGIFLGGDWIETGWPATMEGALRSGSLAAQGALAYLGRPCQLMEPNEG